MFFTSLGLMADARRSTSTSPGLSSGTYTFSIESTDGGPYFLKRRAFILVIRSLQTMSRVASHRAHASHRLEPARRRRRRFWSEGGPPSGERQAPLSNYTN